MVFYLSFFGVSVSLTATYVALFITRSFLMVDSILFRFFAYFLSFISLFGIIFLLLAPLLSGMCCISLGIILITHLASLPSILLGLQFHFFALFLPFFGVPSFSPLPLLSLKPSGKYSIPSDLFPLADWTIFASFFRF